jgi:DNA-binding transcriptional MerR regulator
MNEHFIIGMVAKHYGISKQTLIHYDRIGLLEPSITGENNYRYYNFEDLDKLDLILSLKDAGLSLNDIKSYLVEPSLSESIALLRRQNALLEKRIHKLNKTKSKIDYKINELEKVQELTLDSDIHVKTIEERYILAVDINFEEKSDFAFGLSIQALNNLLESEPQYFIYGHSIEGVILPAEKITTKQYSHFSKLYIFIDVYSNHPHEHIVAQAEYVCSYHHGYYTETHSTYERLLNYIDENKYEIIGDALEIPLITAWSAKGEQDYVMEIQIPVKKC